MFNWVFGSVSVGVSYDVTGKKVDDNVKYAGLHSGVPGFTFIKFPAVFKSVHFEELKVNGGLTCYVLMLVKHSITMQTTFRVEKVDKKLWQIWGWFC